MYAGKQEGAYLKHLRAQSDLVKIGLGQAFEGIFTTVNQGGIGKIIEVDSADRREIPDRRWVTGQDLADLVNDDVTSGTDVVGPGFTRHIPIGLNGYSNHPVTS